MFKNSFSIIIIILLFFSCKEKPVEVPDFVPPESDRVVLIEELTGVKCVNCPQGAEKIQELLQLFEGQLVAMAIHGDILSDPYEESKYDFRYPDAYDLEQYLKPFWGKPAAAINRVGTEEEQAFLGPDSWVSYINDELVKAHQLDIDLETIYNEASRELSIKVGVIALDELEGTFNINVGITESHIIDLQLGPDGLITNYEHNHVLKEMITDVKGDLLTSKMTKNQIINKSYSFTLPEDENLWVAENCHVVAFVSRIEGDTKHVLQAAEAKVVE